MFKLFIIVILLIIKSLVNAKLPEIPSRSNNQRISMGQVPAVSSRDINEIKIKNSDEKVIGIIHIHGMYTNTESWDHLKKNSKDSDSGLAASEPAGPHNRRIISNLININFNSSFMLETDKKDKDSLNKIADYLNKNKGLPLSEKEILSPEHMDFKNAVLDYIKETYQFSGEFKF